MDAATAAAGRSPLMALKTPSYKIVCKYGITKGSWVSFIGLAGSWRSISSFALYIASIFDVSVVPCAGFTGVCSILTLIDLSLR